MKSWEKYVLFILKSTQSKANELEYTVKHKFLNELLYQFIKFKFTILEKTKLFRYECSDKNDNPSKKSRELLDMIAEEGHGYNATPTLWDGYKSFNNTLKKTFSRQERLDKILFDEIYAMV